MNMERREGMDFGARADFALKQLAEEMGAEKTMEEGKWKLKKENVETIVETTGSSAVSYEVKDTNSGKVIEKGMLDGLDGLSDRIYKKMHEGLDAGIAGERGSGDIAGDVTADQSVSDAIAAAQSGKRRERAEAAVRGQERMGTSRTHVSGDVPTQVGKLDTPTKVDESPTRLGVEPSVTQDLPYEEAQTQTGDEGEMAA